MTQRQLYLAAYDISCNRRLRKALYALRGYASGGQKSVFECFLTPTEKRQLLEDIAQVINPVEDRLFCCSLRVLNTFVRWARRFPLRMAGFFILKLAANYQVGDRAVNRAMTSLEAVAANQPIKNRRRLK